MSILINNNYGQVNHIEGSVVYINPQGKIDVEHKKKDEISRPTKRKAVPFEPDFITFTKERTSDYNIIALYQELQDRTNDQWLHEDEKTFLISKLHDTHTELKYLFDVIELVVSNFNLRAIREFMDK